MKSISHPLAIILKQAINGGYDQNSLVTLLNAADEEIDSYDFSNAPLDVIATYIHQLYLNNSPEIRSVLLRLVLAIENMQSESILETYNFDKIVALSFDHRLNQDSSVAQSQKDEEKYSAFGVVYLLNKKKRSIPISIIRALVSYYNSLNTQNSNITTLSYKSILILYLCEAIINDPKQILAVPDLGQIIVDALASGSPSLPAMNDSAIDSISNLFIYSIEKNYDFTHQKNCFSHLIKPFATFKPSPPNDSKKMQMITSAVAKILKTWPGILHAGFRLGMLADLVECLPHQPEAVISLFRELLVLEDKASIWDPYTGILLYGLTQLGFIKQLHSTAEKTIENERESNQSTSSSTISSFLNKLLPFVTLAENTSTANPEASTTTTAIAIASSSSKTIDPQDAYRQIAKSTKKSMAHTMGDSRSITKQTTVPKYSEINNKSDKYQLILEVLTVIIPPNEIELKSENTKQFCLEVLNSFKENTNTRRLLGGINQQCLIALLQLLVTQENLFEILMNNEEFTKKLKDIFEKAKKNEIAEDVLPYHLSGITVLTRNERGTEYLKKKGVADILITLGSTKDNPNAPKVTDEKIANIIINQLDIRQDISIEKQILISFLNSPIQAIREIAISKVKSYQNNMSSLSENNSFESKSSISKEVFETVVIPYVEYSNCSEDSIELFVEILNSDPFCLECAIKYEKIFDELRKQESHCAYSLFFSKPESFKKTIVGSNGETVNAAEYELEWWMKEGVILYVKKYDNSIAKNHVTPPHLFGMLCKTNEGRELAKSKIPKLVDLLVSSKKMKGKRGALFALSQYGSKPHQKIIETLQEAKAVETMFEQAFKSDSLVLKGSLIVALSMMAPTKYLTSLLDANHWQYFRFGSHMSVVPTNVIDYIGGLKEIKFTPEQFSYKFTDDNDSKKVTEEMKKYGFLENDDKETIKDIESILKNLLLLICPLTQNQARNELKNLLQKRQDLFDRPELFLAVQEILTKFDITSDNRFMISRLFTKTPLYNANKDEFKFDSLAEATLLAKLFTFMGTPVPLKTLSETQVPKYPANHLKNSKVCPSCPEAYLEDNEFETATGKSKDAFYNSLSDEERDKIRKNLLK